MTLKKCNSCVIYKPGSESDILIKARVVCDDDTIHIYLDLNQETLFSSKGHGYFSGTIHNISVGGLYLTTDTRLEKDEQLEFQYCFMMKLLKVRAAVLRETVIRDNYYGYGCLFVNLSNGAEKDIRQFVYRQQRKNSNSYE